MSAASARGPRRRGCDPDARGACDPDVRRDLHDRLGPVLSALTLRVSTIRDHLDRDDAAHTATARDLLARLEEDLDDVIAEVRAILHGRGGRGASGGGDGRGGLSVALAARVRVFTQARGQAWITLDTTGAIDELPGRVQRELLLVVSEALTNVVRHSGAAECVVEVHRDRFGVRLRVVDDGRRQHPADQGEGMGVASMRSRIERLGGALDIRSRPGGGTEVVATIPATDS
ncbi:MAG: ATP-binding protein [Tetrasphaera sp.]